MRLITSVTERLQALRELYNYGVWLEKRLQQKTTLPLGWVGKKGQERSARLARSHAGGALTWGSELPLTPSPGGAIAEKATSPLPPSPIAAQPLVISVRATAFRPPSRHPLTIVAIVTYWIGYDAC